MAVKKAYPIDNSAILYLAQMNRDHSNVYRFTVTLSESVCPEQLQQAADRIYTRFPTIFAGFRPGIFSYSMIPADSAPQVAEDPGLLLTMRNPEMQRCAYRIYYNGCEIIIEAFHALTDGHGAIASIRALLSEYLYLRHGVASQERQMVQEAGEPVMEQEVQDAYLDHSRGKPRSVPNRQSYQLPGENRDWRVKTSVESFSAGDLLKAARSSGVSMTAMLSGIMAESIMEIQKKYNLRGREKPVRIMVPIDLRRQFPSGTLRNFIRYALPTMEPGDIHLPRGERLRRLQEQLRHQTAPELLGGQIARNVQLQNNLLFRMTPLELKCAMMRLVYRFFGERNSSITLTNLGPVWLSESLRPFIRGIDVHLTPRRQSPYNCGLISWGDTTSITITRFGAVPELEYLFFGKLRSLLAQ